MLALVAGGGSGSGKLELRKKDRDSSNTGRVPLSGYSLCRCEGTLRGAGGGGSAVMIEECGCLPPFDSLDRVHSSDHNAQSSTDISWLHDLQNLSLILSFHSFHWNRK